MIANSPSISNKKPSKNIKAKESLIVKHHFDNWA